MQGSWAAGGVLRGRTPWAQRVGNPAWEAGPVSSILTTKYFLLVNITLMTNNLNFTCFGQQWFLRPPLLYIYAHVCANTSATKFSAEIPTSKRITGQKEGRTREINSIHILDWSEEQCDTKLKAVCH